MKKEKLITFAMLMVLGICLFMFSGCGTQSDEVSMQDLYVVGKLADMEIESDCLTCIGCVRAEGPGCSSESYSGCIDCFGITVDEGDTADDMFSVTKIWGGGCGCNSYYWVTFPIPESDGDSVPVYGCAKGL